ncbi:helix-turn-helix domain-containing protein [Bacillus aerius]|uniref:helix-turn-helix domain-containing protein n=1 Tax=Bacillus TaxID=1386 RepID=UPI0032AF4966
MAKITIYGNKLGISAYTAYELGKREPDHNTLIAISNILDVSIDVLPKGRNNKSNIKKISKH